MRFLYSSSDSAKSSQLDKYKNYLYISVFSRILWNFVNIIDLTSLPGWCSCCLLSLVYYLYENNKSGFIATSDKHPLHETLNLANSICNSNPTCDQHSRYLRKRFVYIMTLIYWQRFISILPWIRNHMPSRAWNGISHPNDAAVEVWVSISNFIPYFITDVITCPC